MTEYIIPTRLQLIQSLTRRAVEAETELHVLKVVAGHYLHASTLGSYEEQHEARSALQGLVDKPWPGEH